MNNLPKALARLMVLTRSMTPQARLVAALVLGLILISIAYLLNVGVTGDRVYLFGGKPVDPNQIGRMEAAFAEAGLNDATFEGDCIRVPRGQQSRYLGALADADALPHNFGDLLRKMLESNTFLTDKKAREERMKIGMQMELSRLISRLNDEIEWATVIYDVQPPSGLNPKREVRACVTVKPKDDHLLSKEQARQIKNIVGPAIGATPQQVTVVGARGGTYEAGTDETSSLPGHELYAATQQEYERDYREKIQSALSFVPGAVVTVNVELHSEVEDTAQSVKIDGKSIKDGQPEERNRVHAPAALGGPQSFKLDSLNAPATLDLSGAGGYETHHVKRAGLTPKRVTVSVAVPSEYFAQVWRERSGRSSQAEPDAEQVAQIEKEIRTKIEQHVSRVVPAPEGHGADLASLVTVTAFPQMPLSEPPQLSRLDQALGWLNDHNGLVMAVVLCFLGLLMLRSIVRSAARAAGESTPPRREAIDLPHDLPEAPRYSRSRRRRSWPGNTMRDELSEIVRDDPTAAAGVLRSWIGSAN